jgi:hypothetical protein
VERLLVEVAVGISEGLQEGSQQDLTKEFDYRAEVHDSVTSSCATDAYRKIGASIFKCYLVFVKISSRYPVVHLGILVLELVIILSASHGIYQLPPTILSPLPHQKTFHTFC